MREHGKFSTRAVGYALDAKKFKEAVMATELFNAPAHHPDYIVFFILSPW